MRARVFAVVLLAGLGLAVDSSATKPVNEIPVGVTLDDEAGVLIQSDGQGPYTDGVDGVRAVLVSLGHLAMKTNDTASSPARMLFFDFTGECSGPCDPPFSTLPVAAFVSTSDCDLAGGLRDMSPGAFQKCNLNVNFGAEGLGWFVRFGEDWGTTEATVTRVSPTSWTIEVAEGGVARLLSYRTKGRLVLTPRGDFVLPFHMTVTLAP